MKSLFKKIFVITTILRIKNEMPPYLLKSIKVITPFYLVGSILEIFSLALILPVINCTLQPELIHTNQWLNWVFTSLDFKDDRSFLLFLFCIVTCAFILKNIIFYLVTKFQNKLVFELSAKLAFEKYRQYVKNKNLDFKQKNSSEFLRNVTQLPFELVTYLIIPTISLINELFIILLIISAIACFNPILLGAMILFISPMYFVYSKSIKKKLKTISIQRDELSKSLFRITSDSLHTHEEIELLNVFDYFKRKFTSEVKNYSEILSNLNLINGIAPKIVETLAILGISSIYIFGSLFELSLNSIATFLVLFALATFRLIPSLNKIILSSNYIKSSAYIIDYFKKEDDELLNKESEEVETELKFETSLSIKNLTYSFKNGHQLFDELSLDVLKGKKIGIVGESGAGKSTLLSVLLLQTDTNSPAVFLDNKAITSENVKKYYQLISFVPQQIHLLDGTIKENICFGIPENEINEIAYKDAIKQAQLTSFIESLPNKGDTVIGENGSLISGGQRQRVGIARALYHGGSILVFDEATSSLDSETEFQLTESLNSLDSKSFTIILVAHREETLKYCDEIYELKKGKLIQRR